MYQQDGQRETQRSNNANSYYSDDEDCEESNMMCARMKNTKVLKNNKNEAKKPQSCTLIVSVLTATNRKNYLALADTGLSATLVNKSIVGECMNNKKTKNVEWTTQGGVFNTTHTAVISELKLPQFTRNRSVQHKMHLFNKNKNDQYDFIFGRDFMQVIGLDILFSKKMIAWDGFEVEMLGRDDLEKNLDNVDELHTIDEVCAVELKIILDAQYEKPDLKVVADNQIQLTGLQREAFLEFLVSKESAL